jgi:hypothetical protein
VYLLHELKVPSTLPRARYSADKVGRDGGLCVVGACNQLAAPGGGVVRDAGQLRGTAAVDCDVKKPAGWPPSAGAAETACAAAETACAEAEAENAKLRRELRDYGETLSDYLKK